MNPSLLTIAENELATTLGLPRVQIAKFRAEKLTAGEHFKKDGNLIVWLPDGVAALEAELARKKETAAATPPATVVSPDTLEERPTDAQLEAAGRIAIAEELAEIEKKKAAEPQPEILEVVRAVTNRHVVLARRRDDAPGADPITVRGVRNNQHLTPRQLILARPDPCGHVWNWHGPHPTRRGQILVRIEPPPVPAPAPKKEAPNPT